MHKQLHCRYIPSYTQLEELLVGKTKAFSVETQNTHEFKLLFDEREAYILSLKTFVYLCINEYFGRTVYIRHNHLCFCVHLYMRVYEDSSAFVSDCTFETWDMNLSLNSQLGVIIILGIHIYTK